MLAEKIPAQFDPNYIAPQELIVDHFAGGGGASLAIEQALGRQVDIANNHDEDAIDMHKVNHPDATHYCEDIWQVDPVKACGGRHVGLLHASPACNHFSKASGNSPVTNAIRGLAWVVIKWALSVPVRIITLENVEEFKTWGPLVKNTKGKLKPDPEKKGQTFEAFVLALTTGLSYNHPSWMEAVRALKIQYNWQAQQRLNQGLGYALDHFLLKADEFGAGTIRRRLFLVARNDGLPIVRPKPTHGNSPDLKPVVTAADSIQWDKPGGSIFCRKKGPLAKNTLERIAVGFKRFVLNNPNPYVVRIGQTGYGGNRMSYPITKPIGAITKKNEFLLLTPVIDYQFSRSTCGPVSGALGTITTKNKTALVNFALKNNGAENCYFDWLFASVNRCQPPYQMDHSKKICELLARFTPEIFYPRRPLPSPSNQNSLTVAHQIKMRNGNWGDVVDRPVHTISAGGLHHGLIETYLVPYYGNSMFCDANNPLGTITTRDRFAIVSVFGNGYRPTDILMRMFNTDELYKAQGFPETYNFKTNSKGQPVTNRNAVARVGNSVSPPPYKALIQANIQRLPQIDILPAVAA